ncbi:hypothetical protein L6R52_04230 [Myxococcota bacterium]|nr:hypothetical protein [Myxococcota bacterium]
MPNPRDIAARPGGSLAVTSSLGRFVDRLIQTFEDCRGGLSDDTIAGGTPAVERFFLDLYEKEAERFEDTIRDQPLLDDEARAKLRAEIDARIRKVVIPAYVRLAIKFTPRERNDFYALPEKLHTFERIGLGVAGIILGLLVIAAPFIPLWSKEWVVPFMIAGLVFPNIRRYFALRRYEKELNQLVARTDRDFARIDVAYLTGGTTVDEELANVGTDAELQRRLAERAARQKQS